MAHKTQHLHLEVAVVKAEAAEDKEVLEMATKVNNSKGQVMVSLLAMDSHLYWNWYMERMDS